MAEKPSEKMTKPLYVVQLENSVKELRCAQEKMMDKLNSIHVCLGGTEYDKGSNGGLVATVNKNKADIQKIKAGQTKHLSFWGGVVATLSFFGSGLITYLINKHGK